MRSRVSCRALARPSARITRGIVHTAAGLSAVVAVVTGRTRVLTESSNPTGLASARTGLRITQGSVSTLASLATVWSIFSVLTPCKRRHQF